MTNAEKYKKLAAELRAKAGRETSPRVRAELRSLAECYDLLAERSPQLGPQSAAVSEQR
jgi:hypothetical protein